MSDADLCKTVGGGLGTAVENEVARERKLNCLKDYGKPDPVDIRNSYKTAAKKQPYRYGDPLKMGMTKEQVMIVLGMTGYPVGRHVTTTSYAEYEHWELCHDWLNKWNLSRITCNPVYDSILRIMFVDGKLESASS